MTPYVSNRDIRGHVCRYGSADGDDSAGLRRLERATRHLQETIPAFGGWKPAFRQFLGRFCGGAFHGDGPAESWFAAAAIPAGRAHNPAGYLVRLVRQAGKKPELLNLYCLLSDGDARVFRARTQPRFVGLRAQDLAVIGWTMGPAVDTPSVPDDPAEALFDLMHSKVVEPGHTREVRDLLRRVS